MLRVQRALHCPSVSVGPTKVARPKLHFSLLDLPPELGDLLLARLDSRSLSALACVCSILNKQTCSAERWKELFEERWGPATALQEQAAELAGGWKKLYACKARVRELCPSRWEIQAAIEAITACQRPMGLACCALIDGSGSMCGGDFDSMTAVVAQLSDVLLEIATSQVSVIQFSGRTQVEVPLQKPNKVDCSAVMKRVTRMNGGTNMASAFIRASQEMQSLEPDVQRVIIMMSDFRIDDYSASEAVAAAKSVVKEQPNTTFFAFGVGRFVDLSLVKEIMAVGHPRQAVNMYLSLGFQEDSPMDDY